VIAERPELKPEHWLEAHGEALYRYARSRLQDASAVEDVVQETLLAAYQSQDRFTGRSSERTWLIGILRHKIIDYVRKDSRLQLCEDTALFETRMEETLDKRGHWRAAPAEWATNPRKAVEQKEFQRVLAECLEKLEPRFNTAFTMRELEGMEMSDICKALDITPNNLSVILHRARARLRNLLEERWLTAQYAAAH